MIKPITDQGASSIDVIFPGKDEVLNKESFLSYLSFKIYLETN